MSSTIINRGGIQMKAKRKSVAVKGYSRKVPGKKKKVRVSGYKRSK